jgi:ferredoxin
MANLNERIPDNAPGRYYDDANCIDCEQCQTTAPTLFARNPDKGSSYVRLQPATPSDMELIEEVRQACPNQAIGDDGS